MDLPLLCLVAIFFLSLIWAINPAYSFKEIKGELLKGVLVFYLAAYIAGRPDRLKPTWLILGCGNLLLVVYACWDFWRAGGTPANYFIRPGFSMTATGNSETYLITVFPYLLVPLMARPDQMRRYRGWLLALVARTCWRCTSPSGGPCGSPRHSRMRS